MGCIFNDGIYPINPGSPVYALTTPSFDKVTIHLNPSYYEKDELVILKQGNGSVSKVIAGQKQLPNYFIEHSVLTGSNTLNFYLKPN